MGPLILYLGYALYFCIYMFFYRDPYWQPYANIGLWDINRKDIYVIYYTSNTTKRLWFVVCSCRTTTLRTCIVWTIFLIHCKTIHWLTYALFGGQPSINPSLKLQATSEKVDKASRLACLSLNSSLGISYLLSLSIYLWNIKKGRWLRSQLI